MSTLGPDRRAFIAPLAEAMIPRSQGMPGASDIALVNAPLDRVLKHRPDLATSLDTLPDAADDESAEAYLARLEERTPNAYQALLQAVLGAYYMHPEVKRCLGYQGQQAQTLPRGGFGGEDLIEPLLGQRPRYRDPSR